MAGLEELDWIPVGIFDLNLPAAWTGLHLIAELHSCFLERVYACRQIRYAQDHSIGSTRPLRFTAGDRTRS